MECIHDNKARRGHRASTLTTFSFRVQPRDLPLYDHENLGACFTQLDEMLRDLLETVIPGNYVSLPLKLIRPAIYAASVFEDRFLENTRMYLAVRADMDEAELIQKVPQLVKVCSPATSSASFYRRLTSCR